MGVFDLKLDDDEAPIPGEAQAILDEIETLLADDADRWQFAEETLRGISETIERTGRVTERQRLSVDNIRNSVEDRDARRFRRR